MRRSSLSSPSKEELNFVIATDYDWRHCITFSPKGLTSSRCKFAARRAADVRSSHARVFAATLKQAID
jgi:hypothetical protein